MSAFDRPVVETATEGPGLSRRGLLAGALGVGAGLMLAGCATSGAGSPSGALTALAGGSPVRGGTIRVGVQTGGPTENLFPGTAAVGGDFIRISQLYSPLFFMNSGDSLFPLEPGLALSAESNATATLWTFHLRPDVTWHDGKPFTANDVISNLQGWMSNPATSYGGGLLAGFVDFKNVKAIDKHTVQIPLLRAHAQLPSLFTNFNLFITPAGKSPAELAKSPIGTGPFKFKSFTPGQQSVFIRNANYWEAPKPHFDAIVVNSSFGDSSSMVNALLSGALDVATAPDAVTAVQQRSNSNVVFLESKTPTIQPCFAMRVDQGPFADVRVRQAFKYLMNRQEILNASSAGLGSVAYDLLGNGNQFYATDLKRPFDPDKARSLFKSAGVLGNTFVLPSPPIVGLDKAASVLAQQARVAGVTVQVKTASPATYWSPADQVYVRPFAQDYIFPFASLAATYTAQVILGCPFNDTWWGHQQPGGTAANDLILKAIGTLDEQRAGALWHQVQQQQFDEGGYLVWGDTPSVDIVSPKLRGLKESGALNLNMASYSDGWFAS